MLQLRSVDGAPVLFVDDVPVAGSLDDLLHVLTEVAAECSVAEVRWLGSVAVVLAAGMRDWPRRDTIGKYISEVAPRLSRDLDAAFEDGQELAFDEVPRLDAPGLPVGEVGARLATWVAD